MAKGSLLISGDFDDPYVIPGPSLGLNNSLNGGIMAGRLHTFWGPKASGKTTYAMHCIAEAQKMGKRCAWIDSEKTYSKKWAEACGVDTKALLVMKEGANSAEKIVEALYQPIVKGEIDVFVIDSLSSIFMDDYLEGADYKGIATGARSHNFLVSKLLGALTLNTTGILIAHMTMGKKGMGFASQAKMSHSVEHWSSSVIKFWKGGGTDSLRVEDDKSVSIRTIWTVEKSKQSKYPDSGEYWMNVDEDVDGPRLKFDNLTELVDVAINKEVLAGKGWYSFGEHKFQGKPGWVAALQEDEALYAELKGAVFPNG